MTVKQFILCGASAGMLSLALVATGVLTSGCEEATGTRSLTVDPEFADLTGSSTSSTTNNTFSQTFTVSEDSLQDLSLPLEWRVSNTALGRIASSGGRSASYVRTGGSGDNSIFVVDQFGAEGIATVRQ